MLCINNDKLAQQRHVAALRIIIRGNSFAGGNVLVNPRCLLTLESIETINQIGLIIFLKGKIKD